MPAHPLESLGNIYVINLKSRPDRRREMQKEFSSIGLASADMTWFDAVVPNSRGPFQSKGARGCFLSHLAILTDAAEKMHRRILILEDDASFERNALSRMLSIVKELEGQQWDIFYGGGFVDARTAAGDQIAVVDPETPIGCSHFISVQGAAIARLKNYIEAQLDRPEGDPAGGPMPIDGSYSWARRELGLRTFIATPDLCHQRASRSNITPGWRDRIWGIREAVKLVRQLRFEREKT